MDRLDNHILVIGTSLAAGYLLIQIIACVVLWNKTVLDPKHLDRLESGWALFILPALLFLFLFFQDPIDSGNPVDRNPR